MEIIYVWGLLLLVLSVVIARSFFLLARRFFGQESDQSQERETVSSRLGITNCPACHEEMGVGEVVCPHCAHDVAAFSQGRAAAALEVLQRRIVARARRTRAEGIVVYLAFAVFGTGAIIFGVIVGSWLSIAAGVLTLVIEGLGYWLDRARPEEPVAFDI
jgi:hypothetical protein